MRHEPLARTLALLLLTSAVSAQVRSHSGPDAGNPDMQAQCVVALRDQATGGCLGASSVPTVGRLFPLSQFFSIDPGGLVGVGTLAPARTLDVVGVIRSRVGGMEFPDGTLQTTATLQGPPGVQGAQGQQGPPGPLEPPPLATPIGTVTFPGTCASTPIYDLSFSLVSFSSPDLSVTREVNACSQDLYDAFRFGTLLPEVIVVVGDLKIFLTNLRIDDWILTTPDGEEPRVEMSFDPRSVKFDWTGAGGPTSGEWDFQFNIGSGSPSLAGASVTWQRPDLDPVPTGVEEILSASQVLGAVVVEGLPSALVPSAFHAAASGIVLGASEMKLMVDDNGTDKERVLTSMTNPRIQQLDLTTTPTGELRSTLLVDPGISTTTFF